MGKTDKEKIRHETLPEPVPAYSGSDRRIRGSRLDVSFPVTVTHRGHPIQGYVEAVNLSWSGMLLATNFPLNVKDEIVLEFRLPESYVSITVKARVVHREDGRIPEEATLVGVRFLEPDPNVERLLTGFVLEHLSAE
jgi:hypothetical protein